jgi:GST-like protein
MIDFYCWQSGNNRKIYMMLEETGLPYREHVVNLRKKEQKAPAYLAINPNGKVPAIIDSDGPGGKPFTLFESGAILIYLAEKTGRFRPGDTRAWFDIVQWLMWQMGGPGALFTEAAFFHERKGEPGNDYSLDRYTKEANRLLCVADKRLAQSEYIAGPEYSIADMALWPHCGSVGRFGGSLDAYPNIRRWFKLVEARPATKASGEKTDAIRKMSAAA